MAYQPSKPALTIPQLIAQQDILDNFVSYQNAWEWDHTSIDNATHNGWHNKVSLYTMNNIPNINASDIGLYINDEGNITIKRGNPIEEYAIRQWFNLALTIVSWRTFSGLLIKSFIRISINTQDGTYALPLPQSQGIPLFSTIYSVLPTVLNDINGTDSNADVLVTGWTITPAQETINIRIWRRNLATIEGTDHPPILINLLVIGKE